MAITSFRAAYAADLPRRATDVAAHAVLAALLPGPWWLQYVPDALVPVLWLHGMATGRFLRASHPALRAHRALHGRGPVGWAFLAASCVVGLAIRSSLPLHVAAHAAVDRLSHGRGWQ